MKLAVFLTFLALAAASPLRTWENQGVHQLTGPWGLWEHHGETPSQIVRQVADPSIYDQIEHTSSAIKNLQWKMQQHPQIWIDHSPSLNWGEKVPFFWPETGVNTDVVSGAMHHLQKDLEHPQGKFNMEEQMVDFQDNVDDHLHDTIKTGVEAQMAAGLVQQQGVAHGVFVPLVENFHPEVFNLKVQKLIDESNKEDIMNQISHHHHWAQQLHEQQEFVAQQKHQIEVQQLLAHTNGVREQVHHLEQVHHHLHVKEYNLMKEQLAHHVAMLQLQRVLIHKEEQVLQDTVAEQMKEKLTMQGSYPSWQHSWAY
ncbi:putative mediator of RNA polymerase II transcription subunit 12 [Euwallacea fornicatus]|uniref:putative mediator of RNA polymerase II transcription subunit 12 n=1 Tax=Euwallacea fornicatus TaxID=995702 RepID=UPI00338E9740